MQPGDQIIGTANPHLGPLADNGGPTKTHALLSGSPAIDAGDPSAHRRIGRCTTLRRARQRLCARQRRQRRHDCAVIDVGAFEAAGDSAAHCSATTTTTTSSMPPTTRSGATRFGQHVSLYSSADGDGNGIIDAADYNVWKANFGHTPGSGSGSAASASPIEAPLSQSIDVVTASSPRAPNATPARSTIVSNLLSVPAGHSSNDKAVLPASPTAATSTATDDALLAWLSLQTAERIFNHVRFRTCSPIVAYCGRERRRNRCGF